MTESTRKIALFDCDDVIFPYVQRLKVNTEEELGRPLKGFPDSFDMSSWMGVDHDTVMDMIAAFNDRHPDFGTLPLVHGAREAFESLAQAGYSFAFLTSATEIEERVMMRVQNVRTNLDGLDIVDVHCLGVRESKFDLLSSYAPSFWVEDNLKNALLGIAAGHRAYLVPTHHNLVKYRDSENDGVIRASGLDEVMTRETDPRAEKVFIAVDQEDVFSEMDEVVVSFQTHDDIRIKGIAQLEIGTHIARNLHVEGSLHVPQGAELIVRNLVVSGDVYGAGRISVEKNALIADGLDGPEFHVSQNAWIHDMPPHQADRVFAKDLNTHVHYEVHEPEDSPAP